MVLSVFAMSASFAGAAAAQNVDDDVVSVEDFSIDSSDEDDVLMESSVTYETGNFDDSNNVGPVLGVPAQTDLYQNNNNGPTSFVDNNGNFKQLNTVTYEATLTVSANNSEEAVDVVHDISDATDRGLAINEEESSYQISQLSTGTVNFDESGSLVSANEAGEIVATIPANSSRTSTVTFDVDLSLAFEADDPVAGVDFDGIEQISISASGNDDVSASDSFLAIETGATGFSEADASPGVFDGKSNLNADISTATGDQDKIAQFVGSTINVQTTSGSFEVYEAVLNDSDVYNTGDRVLSKVTGDRNNGTIDTSELGAGEYFVGFGEQDDIADDKFIYLDLRTLDLSATADDEITADETLEIDVSSNPSPITAANNVQVWVAEAGDNQVEDVIYADRTELLDVTGETTFEIDPQDDLDGTGEYRAVVLHEDSGIISTTDTFEVVEPLDEEATIVSPRQTDEAYTRGDIMEFEVDLEATDTATITFGDRAAGQNVEVNVTVRADEVGGTAEFYMNSFQIGDGPVFNESDANNPVVRNTDIGIDEWGNKQHGVITKEGTSLVEVEAHESIRIGGGSNDNVERKVVIAPGSYDLTASPGDTAYTEQGSISTDNSIVRLEERDDPTLKAWEAPAEGDESAISDVEFVDAADDSVFDIEAALEQGLITPQDGATAEEDILILQVQTSGLEGLLANQSQANGNLDDFLDRSEGHAVTEAFFDSANVDLFTNQSQAQVEEIVSEVRAEREQEDNLPADPTFGAQALLELDRQKVLAGANDRENGRQNLDEYFLTIPVNSDNIDDLRADDSTIPELVEDVAGVPKKDGLEMFPVPVLDNGNYVIDNIQPTADDEIKTADERPVVFNTTFELGNDVGDTNASAFPENGLFGEPLTETIEWELTNDVVELADTQQTADGPRIFVPAQNDYTIEGTTEIAAGTSMTSQTQTASGEDPAFFYPNEFTVQYVEDGPNTISFSEDFLSNSEIGDSETFAGADFRMTIRRARLPGNLLEGADRRGLPGSIAEVTVVNAHTFNDQDTAGATVTVAEVNVSTSATVEIRDADGNVLGSTSVSEGLNEDVRVVFDEDIEDSQELTSVIVDDDGTEFQEGPSSQTAQVTVAGNEQLYLVDNLQPLTATAAPGDTLDISADITNRGGAGDGSAQTITLTAGPVEATQTVTVAPGETQTVTFEGVEVPSVDEETTVTHTIASEDDDASGSLTISPQDPAFFEITDFSPESATVAPGDEVEATVTVENTGDVEGTQTVTLEADNGLGELGSQEVTLAGGESATETFTFTVPEVDSTTEVTHTISTDDDSVSGTLTVEVESDDTTDDSTSDDSTDDSGSGDSGGSSDDGGPGFGIAAALVAIIGAALLAFRRQQN